jgi:MoaE-MoaD fusion protein
MNVEVLLFARLRELIGKERLVVYRQDMLTVRDVWDGVRAQYPQVSGFEKSLLVSVNQEFAGWDTSIKDGDELAFFPPVSGGSIAAEAPYATSQTGDVVQIVRKPIELQALVTQLQRAEDGAVVVFDGIVRNHTKGRKTHHLEYEGYEPMALKEMLKIEADIKTRWPDSRIGIVHRLGRLEIGEASVVIVVTSAHRKVAFEACQYAIDTLKKTVPIWKKEFFEDGEVWVEGEMSSLEDDSRTLG